MGQLARGGGVEPATIHYLYTAGANTAFGNTSNNDPRVPRSLKVLNTGNLQLLDDSNTWITYPVTAGDHLHFRPLRIGPSSTSNVSCWS